ncbi:MAG TPA: ParA family protein [Spirochaetota bacterium]|nr:ParA family protein [Spirochaetota bacterium]
MKSYAIHILKGGTGKTTTAGNVAFWLGQTSKTLLIDADMQGNSSTWFCSNKNISVDLVDVLEDRCHVSDALVNIDSKFDMLPVFGSSKIKDFGETTLFKKPYSFAELNEEISKLGYDYVVYDMSPSMSNLERCILLSVKEVITPITPEYFAIDGIELFTEELKAINKNWRRNILHDKVVVNNINRSINQHVVFSEQIKQMAYKVFEISQSSKIREAQLNNQSIFEYYEKDRTIPQFISLAKAMR